MTTKSWVGLAGGVGLAMLFAMLSGVPMPATAALPDGQAPAYLSADSRDPTSKGRFTRTVRLVEGGETQVTVVRDPTGDVVARAFTSPGAVVHVFDADGPVVGRSGDSDADDDVDDGDAVWASVRPEPVTQAQAERMAEEYTQEVDNERTRAVGAPSEPLSRGVYDSGCIQMGVDKTGDEFQWSGCFRRHIARDSDPNAYYRVDVGRAWGNHRGFYGYLDWGSVGNHYSLAADATVVDHAPDHTITRDCEPTTIGFSFGGASYQRKFEACNKIVPHWTPTHARAVWGGNSRRDEDVRGAAVITLVRYGRGTNDDMAFRIGADEDD